MYNYTRAGLGQLPASRISNSQPAARRQEQQQVFEFFGRGNWIPNLTTYSRCKPRNVAAAICYRSNGGTYHQAFPIVSIKATLRLFLTNLSHFDGQLDVLAIGASHREPTT
jgi:hypothetical protein